MAQLLNLSKQVSASASIRSALRFVQRNKAPIVLGCTALIVNLYRIQLYPLNGDEYNTISESQHLGLNLMSIVYFAFMHVWLWFGVSELILRFPAALCGVFSAITLYAAGKRLAGERAGIATGLLAATSPFLVYHSQEARFYSFFIFATCLFIYMTLTVFSSSISKKRAFFALAISAIVLMLSHFLGAIALAAQGLAAIASIAVRRFGRRVYFLIPLLFSAFFIVPILPPIQALMWKFYQDYANTTTASGPTITVVSLVNVIKVAFSFYIFSFGYHVYPLWWFIVVPGVLITGILLVTGLIWIFRNTSWGMMPILSGIALLGAYLVLDPIAGRLASGISPRHVAFVWPVYLLVVAVGLASLPRRAWYSVLCILVALNIAALYPRWTQMWSYSGLLDYRSAAAFVNQYQTDKSIILHDGRSEDAVAFYYPPEISQKNYWPYLQSHNVDDLSSYDRIILVSNDYQLNRRQETNRLLALLESQFTVATGRVEYPLFEYVLARKPDSEVGFELDPATRQVHQPVSEYGLEFQDLHLPIRISALGQPFSITGAFSVPDLAGQRELSLPLAGAPEASRLIMLSSLVGAEHITAGQQIGRIDVETSDGSVQSLPLRYGEEVQDWSLSCSPQAACQTVETWHKRIAFVGQQSYSGSTRDFQAGIHATSIRLPKMSKIKQVIFQYDAPAGSLYVWGIAIVQ